MRVDGRRLCHPRVDGRRLCHTCRLVCDLAGTAEYTKREPCLNAWRLCTATSTAEHILHLRRQRLRHAWLHGNIPDTFIQQKANARQGKQKQKKTSNG